MTNKTRLIVYIVVLILISIVGLSFLLRGLILKKRSTNSQEKIAISIEKSDQTQKINEGNELNETLLKDFPIYQQAELISSWSTREGGGEGTSASWRTSDNTKLVYLFYKSGLESKGWKLNNTNELEDSYTISFSKEDRQGFIGITTDDSGKTIISVTIGVR